MSFTHSRTARICSRNLLALAVAWLLWSAGQVLVTGQTYLVMYESMGAQIPWPATVAASRWLAAALVLFSIAAIAKERWLRNQLAGICLNAGLVVVAAVLDAVIVAALFSPMLPLVSSLQAAGTNLF
jgi:hypothetical protein